MIICSYCGNSYDERYGACPRCGNPPYSYPQMANPIPQVRKKKSLAVPITVITVIGVFVIGILIAVLMLLSKPAPNAEVGGNLLDEQLSLGEKYLLEENYDEAIIAFHKAIEIEPNNPELYIKLADVYIAKNDSENAVKTLEQGYEQTADETIRKKLDDLKIEIQYDELMSEGSTALSDEKYTEAVQKFEAAIKLKPEQPQPYLSASEGYLGTDDTDNALKILEQGYEKTNSAEIKKKLDEINNNINYKENFLNALIEKESEIELFDSSGGTNSVNSSLTFNDLDGDGKLELIVVVDAGGNGSVSTGNAFAVKYQNGKLIKTKTFSNEFQTYYDTEQKKYRFFNTYSVRDSVRATETYEYELIFEDSEVKTEYYAAKIVTSDNNNSSAEYYQYDNISSEEFFSSNKVGKEISEDEYDKIQIAKSTNLEPIYIMCDNIPCGDYQKSTTDKKRTYLENAYDSFTYYERSDKMQTYNGKTYYTSRFSILGGGGPGRIDFSDIDNSYIPLPEMNDIRDQYGSVCIDNFIIINNCIYFTNEHLSISTNGLISTSTMYKCNMDGSNLTEIIDDVNPYFVYANDTIYFETKNKNTGSAENRKIYNINSEEISDSDNTIDLSFSSKFFPFKSSYERFSGTKIFYDGGSYYQNGNNNGIENSSANRFIHRVDISGNDVIIGEWFCQSA